MTIFLEKMDVYSIQSFERENTILIIPCVFRTKTSTDIIFSLVEFVKVILLLLIPSWHYNSLNISCWPCIGSSCLSWTIQYIDTCDSNEIKMSPSGTFFSRICSFTLTASVRLVPATQYLGPYNINVKMGLFLQMLLLISNFMCSHQFLKVIELLRGKVKYFFQIF